MTKERHRREKTLNRGLSYSFKGLFLDHYGRKHSNIQVGMVAESLHLCLQAGRQAKKEGERMED